MNISKAFQDQIDADIQETEEDIKKSLDRLRQQIARKNLFETLRYVIITSNGDKDGEALPDRSSGSAGH
jgi:predicted RNA binding protein with dsRBD fold (UPF0201 family)